MCYCGRGGMNRHQMGLYLPGNGCSISSSSSAVVLPHKTIACSVSAVACKERKNHVICHSGLGDMTAGSEQECLESTGRYHSEHTDATQDQACSQLINQTSPDTVKNVHCCREVCASSLPRENQVRISDLPIPHRGGSAPPRVCEPSSSLQEPNDKTKESSRWLGFMAGFRNSGCSVVIDKSADLIELTDESTVEDNELCRSASCSCPVRPQRKWFFSRHKCKSLDGSGEPIHVFHFPSQSSIPDLKKPKSSDCLSRNGESSLSTVYSGMSAGPSCPDMLRVMTGVHCDSESNVIEHVEEDFRGRSFSLTPTVNLAVFETESSSECEYVVDEDLFPRDPEMHCQAVTAPLLNRALPCSPSAAQLSLASSATDGGLPICKICHTSSKDGDPLISPCRCSGTMQFIHCGCLMRWLEISSKKSRKPPSCELCQYQYHWHKKFKVRHWQFPHCSRRDKVLHLMFFISVAIMIACATITIMCFKQDKGTKVDPDRTELTESEIVTLVCGVLFFLAFFVAMYVEVKARNTIYKLLVRFVYLNQQWYIDEYEKKESAPVSV